MTTELAIEKSPATPEHVLAVFRDQHRQQIQIDIEASSDISLSFDSSIDEWREACDLLPWQPLGESLNESWRIGCSHSEWLGVLEPSSEKRLRGVCELIARYAVRQSPRPVNLFGCSCEPADMFLAIRSILAKAGADIEEMRPSADLAPFARKFYFEFLGPISRLAPGRLPNIYIKHPFYNATLAAFLVSFASPFIAICFGSLLAALVALGVMVLCWAFLWIAARCVLPSDVTFGDLRTFRDLAIAMSKPTT